MKTRSDELFLSLALLLFPCLDLVMQRKNTVTILLLYLDRLFLYLGFSFTMEAKENTKKSVVSGRHDSTIAERSRFSAKRVFKKIII